MPSPARNQAIDIFRGLTMAFMILVNNPGDYLYVFAPLKHADWHGFTPTDMIYPCFLFIVGVSLYFSLMARKTQGDSDFELMLRILRRAAVLFVLGLVDNGFPFPDLHVLRIPGVLQRIAVVCVMAAFITLKLSPRAVFRLVICLLLGYWMLLTLVPVPMSGKPNLFDPTANVGSWLDYRLLGTHLWLEEHWDPEGILSTFPALCITLFGVMAGRRIYSYADQRELALRFAAYAGVVLALGLVWDCWFPIIRWLWTSSFILLTSGAAFALLALCMAASWSPGLKLFNTLSVAYGANAIVVYMASSLLSKTLFVIRLPGGDNLHDFLYKMLFASWLPPKAASLAWALLFVLIMLSLAWTLYVRRIFIRV